MDQRVLRQFVTVAECLHFGRASEQCHISPSALSRSIRQLEEQAGVSLFDRDNRSVQLTHAGELFLVYARDALLQWDVMRNALMEAAGELQGELSLYCSVTASYSFLFEILSEFRHEHPRIEIKLHTGDPEHAIARVLAGTEDIAIGAKPSVLPAGLAFKSITVSPLVFIAARDNAEYARLAGSLPDARRWAETPMILSERGLSRNRIDEWFRRLEVQPLIYAQVAGNEAIVSMVSLGFGVGVVPRIVLENSPLAETIRVLDIAPQLEAYEVGLFTQERKLKSRLINALWSQLQSPA